jgi:hypothetical protein
MAIKFELVKVGDVLYDRHRTTMGNTKITRLGEWEVRVIEIDHKNRRALISWNSNPSRWVTARHVERLFRSSMRSKKDG